MSILKGIAGGIVTLLGENIYPLPDTAVYFNSISTSGRAQIVEGSIAPDYSSVQVYIPDGLPQFSKIIFYNSVSYVTGRGELQFVGKPRLDSLSSYSGVWRDKILITGKDFLGVTSVKIGDLECSFDVASATGMSFIIPSEAQDGMISVSATGGQQFFFTGNNESLSFQVFEPVITVDGISPTSGRFGEQILISGLSFQKANEIRISGAEEELVITDFERIATTGLRFVIPDGAVTDRPIKVLKTVDITLGGYYLPKIVEQAISSGNLKLENRKIVRFSPLSGIYGEGVCVSGVNLSGASVFFRSYSTGQIPKYYIEPLETIYVDNTGIIVKVPREIIRDNLYLSGNLFNCVLDVSGSSAANSLALFTEYVNSGARGDHSNDDYSFNNYLLADITYQTYTYQLTVGKLAITGSESGASYSGFLSYFSSGYTGSNVSGSVQLLASGVYEVSTSATSGVLTSMLATGLASTGWATSGSIITNYYITSGDIYDVDMLSSPGLFTPLPTITGVADLTVGQPFIITGINCSEIRNLLFITGENRLKSNKREISIIANQDYQFLSKAGEETSYLEYFRYVGKMGFDLIEVIGNLPDSAKTGNFIITGVANDTFIGTGQVFLISKHDSNQTTYDFNYFSDIKNFSSAYPDLYTTNSLSRVISSAHISITGQNNIIAESIKFSEASGLILTGKYLQDITGIFLSGGAYDLSSGVFIKITQSSDVYLEDYLYGLITGTPQGLIANKSFYEDSHHVNLNSVINDYFYLFSDPSNASLSGVPFYDNYLRYYSGQITLLSPYYEIVL